MNGKENTAWVWAAGGIVLLVGTLLFGWDLVSLATYKLAAWVGINPLLLAIIIAVAYVVILVGGFVRILLSDSRRPG
jgi:hypothetical protein